MSNLLHLRDLTRGDGRRAGGKAAMLGELLRAGFPVPDGLVVTSEPDDELLAAAQALGEPWAVRSSAVAEDLPDASYAGQYETVLGVRGADALVAAVHRCRESANETRVAAYQERRGSKPGGHVSVLIQRMVEADAAGVAFTADPLTGDRRVVVITSGRGLGERVVGGEVMADEWRVTGRSADCVRDLEHSLSARQARSLAALCRRIEHHLGQPQDIEWALSLGRFHVLQARPMTALPPEASWTPPSPGHWTRTLRLGEWLNDALTPLFADWLLEELERGYLDGMREDAGAALPFRYAVVNGWYYTAPPRFPPVEILRGAVASRGRLLPFALNALLRVGSKPELADHRLLGALAEKWRTAVLPRYQRAIAATDAVIDGAKLEDAVRGVEDVARAAGAAMWSLAVVGGSAWKMEACLARFLRAHAPEVPTDAVQALLTGLGESAHHARLAAHSVQTLDWYWPTAGELPPHGFPHTAAVARSELVKVREQAWNTCRAALASAPAQVRRFESLVTIARRYAALREHQAHLFTLGWPSLRRCGARLGQLLVEADRLDAPDDVYFVKRSELAGTGDLRAGVLERRKEWERQRRLVPPLSIGTRSRIFEATIDALVHAVRKDGPASADALVGHPASPGRAEGVVRIIRGVEDFDRFAEGDVLVARGTAPAWTPLFARAAAIVTDGGSLAAHASLVAREYGIPAVVGTGVATVRLREGQRVLVDGSAGVVEPR